jgi:uncharacterized protein YndB with AHSA1/START domain
MTSQGQLERVGDRWQLRFERRLSHPPDKVWRALTEPKELAGWFPAQIRGERVAGAPLEFVHTDGAAPTTGGELIRYDPPRLLELRWGTDELRFELEPTEDGCVLTFVDTFDELGKAARDGAGWHVCLERLDFVLAGQEAPWDGGGRWREVHPQYVERLGPEAAAIGPPEGHPAAG